MESMFSSNRPGWAALLDEKVTAYLPDLKYIHDEPLARHTSFRIGGPATRMAFPTSGEQIVLLAGFAQECGVTPFLLGNGTVGNRNVGGAFRRPLFRVDVITQTYSGHANAGSVIRGSDAVRSAEH